MNTKEKKTISNFFDYSDATTAGRFDREKYFSSG
jgi:hypothetical protein